MQVYNYTIYHNFISKPKIVWLKEHCLEIIPEFEDIETALEESEMLSYNLWTDGRSVGRLVFPWMDGWRYEGNFFDVQAIREIGKNIYYWIGLWE